MCGLVRTSKDTFQLGEMKTIRYFPRSLFEADIVRRLPCQYFPKVFLEMEELE